MRTPAISSPTDRWACPWKKLWEETKLFGDKRSNANLRTLAEGLTKQFAHLTREFTFSTLCKISGTRHGVCRVTQSCKCGKIIIVQLQSSCPNVSHWERFVGHKQVRFHLNSVVQLPVFSLCIRKQDSRVRSWYLERCDSFSHSNLTVECGQKFSNESRNLFHLWHWVNFICSTCPAHNTQS